MNCEQNRILELELALKESLRWMGKAIADNAFKDCCGDASRYFDYFNNILAKENCNE